MTPELFIVLLIVGLAWWHREPWPYAFAGFTLLIFGLNYAGVVENTTYYYSSMILFLAIYTFFKAAWDRPNKKKGP